MVARIFRSSKKELVFCTMDSSSSFPIFVHRFQSSFIESPCSNPRWEDISSRVVSFLSDGDNAIKVPGVACHFNVVFAMCKPYNNTLTNHGGYLKRGNFPI
jgi:hypothetical protein